LLGEGNRGCSASHWASVRSESYLAIFIALIWLREKWSTFAS
jgi:hypothetical protein